MEQIFSGITNQIIPAVKIDLITVFTFLFLILCIIIAVELIRRIFESVMITYQGRQLDYDFGTDTGAWMIKTRRKAEMYRGTVRGDIYRKQYLTELNKIDFDDDDDD